MRTDEPDTILANEERFLERLGIEGRASSFLKSADNMELVLTTAGAAYGGGLIASSSFVATTFFPSSGILAWIGLGAAATTPIGWVLAAGALTGGLYFGLRWTLDKVRDKSTVKRPKYINTPLDLIANQLFGLMFPLSVWIAKSDDGEVSEEEAESIVSFYIDEWGYDADFVAYAMERCASEVPGKTARELAKSFSDYCAANRDCNKKRITEFLVDHLREFAGTEGNGESRERKVQALRELEAELKRQTA